MGQKEIKTSQIIEAATREFLSKGLEAASMQNIADQAMVSKRTLYKYYPTKEDLYNALIDEVLSCVDVLYQKPYSSELSIHEQIERIVRAKVELTLTDSFINISKIVFGELLKNRKLTEVQMKRFYQSEQVFIEWIAKAQQDKKVTRDYEASDIATHFHSVLKGQIYWPLLLGLKKREELNLERICTQVVTQFIKQFC